jgi:hypothetical protein
VSHSSCTHPFGQFGEVKQYQPFFSHVVNRLQVNPIGILISDSGRESILKSVFQKKVYQELFFEQEIKVRRQTKIKQNLNRFSMTFQSKRFRH